MKESDFQKDLKKEIKERFPNCIILKNDPTFVQGVPDLLILNNNKWAALEVKVSDIAKKRPNQEHYILKMNEMSYASFIYPENKGEVLHALDRFFSDK